MHEHCKRLVASWARAEGCQSPKRHAISNDSSSQSSQRFENKRTDARARHRRALEQMALPAAAQQSGGCAKRMREKKTVSGGARVHQWRFLHANAQAANDARRMVIELLVLHHHNAIENGIDWAGIPPRKRAFTINTIDTLDSLSFLLLHGFDHLDHVHL